MLNEKEIYWIDYYNSQVPYGYNIARGGNYTNEGKQCVAYKLDGIFYKEYNSTVEASYDIGVRPQAIQTACKKHCRIKNYQFRYKDKASKKLEPYCKAIGISIAQYSLDGEFIKLWNNSSEIYKTLGFSANSITSNIRKDRRSTHGFQWIKILNKEDVPLKINPYFSSYKKVGMYDMDDNLLFIFNGITHASKETGYSHTCITDCCKNRRTLLKNYKFQYI